MRNASILIVDGRVDLMEPLKEIFESKGYNVTMVEDGNKAIWLLKMRKFDILLTPPELPGVNGVYDFEALRALCPSMAVIMVNSVGGNKEMGQITRTKIEAVVDKPFNVKRLVNTVELILEAPLILIVDRKAQEWEVFRNILADKGYRVLVAGNVDEAIEAVRENNSAIAVLDLEMVGTECMGLLETIKKIKPGIEVVMIIDYSSVRLVGQLLKKGAYTCLYKPLLDVERLVKVIEEVRCKRRAYPARTESESPHS